MDRVRAFGVCLICVYLWFYLEFYKYGMHACVLVLDDLYTRVCRQHTSSYVGDIAWRTELVRNFFGTSNWRYAEKEEERAAKKGRER